MTAIASDPQSSPVLTSALAWLNAPAMEDPLHDLAPLRHHLRSFAEIDMAALERLPLIRLFQSRADAINRALRTLLLQTTLPLPQRARLIAQGLTDIHGLLAAMMLRAVRRLNQRQLAQAGETLTAFCTRILANLSQQQQVALLATQTPPQHLWRQAQITYSLLGPDKTPEAAEAISHFKHMLALAAAQPETFTSDEIGLLIDYLPHVCAGVEIDPQPAGPLETWYWLDETRGLPPIAVVRRPPPAGGRPIYFRCTTLAKTAEEHLHQLAEGRSTASLGLPSHLSEDEYRIVLARAISRWSKPPRRRHHHRPSNYSVEICPELGQLWDLLHGRTEADTQHIDVPLTKWTVLNESPGGFAMLHVSGDISGLVSGSALGLRTSPERPWNICLVRWARCNDNEHVELGLELIAPSAAPVQIVRRLEDSEARVAPALLLPPTQDRQLHEALLTTRSRATGRPFTMISVPKGRKLQLTECQVSRLTWQTSSVEMLEFSRDFSPH